MDITNDQVGAKMEAFYSGITAWTIELAIAGIILYILHREEQKVYKRRKKETNDES